MMLQGPARCFYRAGLWESALLLQGLSCEFLSLESHDLLVDFLSGIVRQVDKSKPIHPFSTNVFGGVIAKA